MAHPLGPDVGVHVAALLRHHNLVDQSPLRGAVGQPQPRAQDLAERARIHHRALGVKVLDGGQVLPRNAQLSVGVVLQHRHPVPHRQLVNRPALCKACGVAGGVLEIRDTVKKARLLGRRKHPLQRLQVRPVRLQGHALQPHAKASDGVVSPQKGRLLHRRRVALVAQKLCHKLNDLLAAAGNQDFVPRLYHRPAPVGKAAAGLAQRAVSLGHRILQRPHRVLLQQLGAEPADRLHREAVGRRVAPRKADQLRVAHLLEQLADDAGPHPLYLVGIFQLHFISSSPFLLSCAPCPRGAGPHSRTPP